MKKNYILLQNINHVVQRSKGLKLFFIGLISLLLFFNAINNQILAQGVSINETGAAPDASAALDVSSSSQGVLFPRLTTTERDAITSPVSSLLIFNTTTQCYEGYNAYTSTWVAFGCIGCIVPETFICGELLSVSHTADTVAPVDKDVNYRTVASSLSGSNKCWILQNLGATDTATSATDATEASAGWYWQFNREQGYKYDGTITPPWTTIPIDTICDWLAANDPCTIELGTGWRIPTKTEWLNVNANGVWVDATGAYSSALKLHGAGLLYSDGSLDYRGTYGYYWSSTQVSSTDGWYFHSSSSNVSNYSKAYGFSLRCLRD